MEIQSFNDFKNWKPPYIKNIIDKGVIVEQSKTIIYGKPGIGKSILANQMAFAIAQGEKIFPFDTTKSMVWSIQLEMPKALYHKRLMKFINNNMVYTDNILFTTEDYLKLDKQLGMSMLQESLELLDNKGANVEVVMIDPLLCVLSGDINDSQNMIRFCYDNINSLIKNYKVAFVIVHHTRKSLKSKDGNVMDLGAEEMIGSSILYNWADTIIGVRANGGKSIITSFDKHRYSEEPLPSMKLNLDSSKLKFKPA